MAVRLQHRGPPPSECAVTSKHRDFSESNCSESHLEVIESLGKKRAPEQQGPVPSWVWRPQSFGESKGLFTKYFSFRYYWGNAISSFDLLILVLYLNAAQRSGRGIDKIEGTSGLCSQSPVIALAGVAAGVSSHLSRSIGSGHTAFCSIQDGEVTGVAAHLRPALPELWG